MKAWKWVSAHSCHGSCSTAPGVRTVAETENTGHLSVRARAQSRGHGALSQSQKQGLCCRPAPGRPAKGWGRKDLVSEGSPGPRVWASCSVAWRTLIAGPEMGRSGDDLPKKRPRTLLPPCPALGMEALKWRTRDFPPGLGSAEPQTKPTV